MYAPMIHQWVLVGLGWCQPTKGGVANRRGGQNFKEQVRCKYNCRNARKVVHGQLPCFTALPESKGEHTLCRIAAESKEEGGNFLSLKALMEYKST